MKATLTFANRELAEHFATAWSRYSKRGHIVGAGTENVEVIVHDVEESDKAWIDAYAQRVNN